LQVRVETTARLHLGLIDLHGGLGRKFGSIGAAIERPRLVVEAMPAVKLIVEGSERDRVEEFARRFYAHYAPALWTRPSGPASRSGTQDAAPQAHLRVIETIPAHVGLGSGTQLALAVGTVLARLHDLAADVYELAAVMERGRRSGIGVGAFQQGGFLVDGGCKTDDSGAAPPISVRCSFPPDWLFVVATPEVVRGLSGEREDQAFDGLPSPSPEIVGKICRLLVIKMLPALAERDIVGFGAALTGIQRLVGDVFAPMQAGRYASDPAAELVAYMLAQGALGAGQSSWGPTVYALVQGEEAALALERKVREFWQEKGQGTVFHTRVANQGAQVIVTPT
jgi:beta-ribofuranosylaminobenzene 5'-phosphate synthase